MQTERVTYLTTIKGKAALATRASAYGISMGEYVRRKVEDEDELTPDQQVELERLVAEVNEALPRMQASIGHMIETLDKTHRETDAFLRDMGVR